MDTTFENIVPWNGANDTGLDVRKKWERNFDKIKQNFAEIVDDYVDSEELATILKDAFDDYLNRDKEEVINALYTFKEGIVANELSKFLKGINIGDSFVSGSSGGFLGVDSSGKVYLEIDKILVRIKAYFESLEIKKVSYIAGEEIISPAGGITCIQVEELTDVYRCHFCADDGDIKVDNYFAVDDLAISKDFNIKPGVYTGISNAYYWRRVMAIGDDYIDLSKTDCDANSGIPAKGDKICHLGNVTNADRQAAILLSAVNNYAPCVTLYAGINSYSLLNKEYIQYGYDKNTGKAFHKVYGDAYIGDRNATNYIQLKSDILEICAKFISKTTGKDLETVISNLSDNLDVIKNQTDKQFIIWFGNDTPTLLNEPALDWNTTDLKDTHIDDWYFIKTDNAAGGLAYRFEKNNGVYSWNNITDADTIAALTKAASAETIANGKIRNFVDVPVPPYSIGDLWTKANYTDGSNVLYTNDLLKCKVAKNQGDSFSISDWEPANAATTAYIKNMGDSVKIEILGTDAQGNLNTVLTSINADASGVKIHADKLAIDATVLANLIMATGLQVGVKDAQGNFTAINFSVDTNGNVHAKNMIAEGTIKANLLYTPFKVITYAGYYLLNPSIDGCNINLGGDTDSNGHGYNSDLQLPNAEIWDGLHILVNVKNMFSSVGSIIKTTESFSFPLNKKPIGDINDTNTQITPQRGLYEFISVNGQWLITNYSINIGPFVHTGIKDDSNDTITIDNNITYASFYNSLDKVANLPSNPIPFREIKLYRGGDGSVTINGNGKQLLAAGYLQSTVIMAHKSEMDVVVYNGVNWDYSFGNYN